jgi:hypothetical protein
MRSLPSSIFTSEPWKQRCRGVGGLLHRGLLLRATLHPVGFQASRTMILLAQAEAAKGRDHSCTTATKCHAYDRSHATPSAQQHSTAVFRSGQARKVAPVGTRPVSTYRQSATRSFRASATTMIRRIRPLCSPTRSANHFASALCGW